MKDIRLSRKKIILSVLLLVVVALAGVVGCSSSLPLPTR